MLLQHSRLQHGLASRAARCAPQKCRPGPRDVWLQRFGALRHQLVGPCSSARAVPRSAGVDQSEYSWCSPPARISLARAHLASIDVGDSGFGALADPAGGAGYTGSQCAGPDDLAGDMLQQRDLIPGVLINRECALEGCVCVDDYAAKDLP